MNDDSTTDSSPANATTGPQPPPNTTTVVQFHQVTGKSTPRQGNLATLVGQVALLRRKFAYCSSVLVNEVLVSHLNIKVALKLANEALLSQVTWPEASTSTGNMKETCPICVDDLDGGKMFSIAGCLHRYCYSCMKSHVHVKLVQAMLPKCPHDGCKTDLTLKMCKTFLTPELYGIMKERVQESAIAAADKIYCPYPRCSALMSRTEISANTRAGGSSKCKRCRGLFCLHCKVPWHNNMSCVAYKRSNPSPSVEDAKLKSLARKNLWRQCVKCSHMVELGEGCNHISCRCGHQFCYVCGAEWRNKKATCKCPLFDEQRIIYAPNRQQQRR